MVNKLYYNLCEYLYRSKHVRHILSYFYRLRFSIEKPSIIQFTQQNYNKTIIAINASEIYHFNHIHALYAELVKDESFAVILIGSNPNKNLLPEYQRFLKENHLEHNRNFFSYIWLPVLEPDLFLETAITPYHQLCPARTIKVLFAHGLSSLGFSKNHAHITRTGTYDYILSTGPFQKKALQLAAEKYRVNLPEIIHSGFIRGDVLAEKSVQFDRQSFNAACGLADKKTILFAPTWGEFSATVAWIDSIVDVCVELDLNLLIKLHPLMLNGKTKWETAGVNWKEKLKQAATNKNIHICSRFDLEEYMLTADALITDASSVGIEYMFLRRPVIFLPTPQFFDLFGRDKPIFWVREGLEVQNVTELKEQLQKTLLNAPFTPEYDIQNISFNPGKTVETIISSLKHLREPEPDNRP